MNILSRFTLKTLRGNRVRTTVTVIGIILSAAMITAVLVTVTSLRQYLLDVAIYDTGDWHGAYFAMTAADADALISDDAVQSAVRAQEIGYALYEDANDYKPYMFVEGVDESFFSTMSVRLTDGRLPENTSEIILPEHLFSDDGDRPALGSVITLALASGDRYALDDPDTRLGQFDQAVADSEEDSLQETITISETRTYTVTGYYDKPDFESYSTPGYTALTLWEEGDCVDVYFRAEDVGDVITFLQTAYGYRYDYNSDVLMLYGVSEYDSYYSVVYGMAAILIALIMFGSVSLIYNAFSISVSNRTRQFGLLRSVGATKRQIRILVFKEAVYVSLVGIPLGILAGMAGMAVTFHFLGGAFDSIINTSADVTLRMTATVPATVLAFVVSFVTVLISAWVPSRRAMRVTAIDAIRQSRDVRIKPKEVKTGKLTYRLFGLEGVLARKHFKRDRKGYRATVLSLFMSVVLFIVASSFCMYMTDSVSGVFDSTDYDVYAVWTDSEGDLSVDSVLPVLSGVTGVTQSSGVRRVTGDLYLRPEQVTDEGVEALAGAASVAPTPYGDVEPSTFYYTQMFVYGVDDDTFRQYLSDRGLPASDYFDASNPRAVVKPDFKSFSSETGRVENTTLLRSDAGELALFTTNEARYHETFDGTDMDSLTGEEYSDAYNSTLDGITVTVGAQVSELPFGLNGGGDRVCAVYPLSVFEEIFSGSGSYATNFAYFKASNHAAVADAMRDAAEQADLPVDITDAMASRESSRNLVIIIKVFSYGFIALISLIAVANVFNTISTNLFLRRREFAMLRSVGETDRGLLRMMNYECVLYGLKALMYGLPAAFAATYLMYRTVNEGYDTDFYLPWDAVAIAVGSVFLVVFATMLYAMSKIRGGDTIEDLKAEAL